MIQHREQSALSHSLIESVLRGLNFCTSERQLTIVAEKIEQRFVLVYEIFFKFNSKVLFDSLSSLFTKFVNKEQSQFLHLQVYLQTIELE